MKYGIVIRYEFTPSWLRLNRDERTANEQIFQKEIVGPFVEKMSVRHFDAEAFATGFSDFLLVETNDMQTYYYFIEKLRDSDFVAREWVRIRDISIGIEDGYKEYERDHS
ncbi:darcynin family protein [Frankia sp. Cppng1_Ct_nod]|uniref:darcynin family protein n=1 Tax=Frankia sp. Cppng1_Ct_nod TaxID=2897162 RepID=UPI0013EFA6BC|nr:darcynin family protein [Frankia sp. Cppng1_Ct_nod]